MGKSKKRKISVRDRILLEAQMDAYRSAIEQAVKFLPQVTDGTSSFTRANLSSINAIYFAVEKRFGVGTFYLG